MSRPRDALTPKQREAIYTLKLEGKSGKTVSELCAQGVLGLPGFTVSHQHCNDLFRKLQRERDSLTTTDLAQKGPAEALPVLIERMISIAEREIEGHARDQAQGKLDAREFKLTAETLRALKALADKIPPKPPKASPSKAERAAEGEEAKPTGFLAELLEAEGQVLEPVAPPPMGESRLPSRHRAASLIPPTEADDQAEEETAPAPPTETSIEDRIRMAAATRAAPPGPALPPSSGVQRGEDQSALAREDQVTSHDHAPRPTPTNRETPRAAPPDHTGQGVGKAGALDQVGGGGVRPTEGQATGQGDSGPVPRSDEQPTLPDVVARALPQ